MRKLVSMLLVGCALLFFERGLAQVPAQAGQNSPDLGVSPTTVIDRAEVRVLRVELQPGATRRIHAHDDVQFHLFIPITGAMDVNLGAGQPVKVEPWKAYFFTKGTRHGFTNTGSSPVVVMEVFVKPGQTAGIRNADDALAFGALRH